MSVLREKIIVQYHDTENLNFETQSEYFGGLPRIKYKDWPFQKEQPGTHLLSIQLPENEEGFVGLAIFFHLDCNTNDAYSFIKFRDNRFSEKPAGAILMPNGRIIREAFDDDTCLDYSFVSTEPIMRSGPYKGDAFLAQLTNDILPFPGEPATLYLDLNHPPFWQI